MLRNCFFTKLWFNSEHIFKQFTSIGDTFSSHLVNAKITSFNRILEINPRRLESILNKKPPFGDSFLETIKQLPFLRVEFNKINEHNNNDFNCKVDVTCYLTNCEYISECGNGGCLGMHQQIFCVIGDGNNTLLCTKRIT